MVSLSGTETNLPPIPRNEPTLTTTASTLPSFLRTEILDATDVAVLLEHVRGDEQPRDAMALKIVRDGPAFAGVERQQGWVRASAWLCDFSSIDSTTAWAGGSMQRPTMSSIISAKAGSVQRLKVRKRCGCSR